MNDEQLLRYSRHLLLNQIGIEGQERILAAHVLIIGVGGLGCPAGLYLAAAGVGQLTLADGDRVEMANLQRQILHTENQLGLLKTDSGKTALAHINPEVLIDTIPERLVEPRLDACIDQADVILDCSDNFATRYAINRACLRHRKPLISGAALRFNGQVAVFDFRHADTPCYHCLFPEGEDLEEMRCATLGVFSPLTGIIGAMQAAEALKIISGTGQPLVGQLLLLDALTLQTRYVSFKRDPACEVCS